MADQDELRQLQRPRRDRARPTRSREHGVDLDRALEARTQLANAAAYLELHIEQGPVLESLDLPLGAVIGTFGVERSRFTWTGQAAHAGSTPMDQRRDALAGAAKLALEIRDIAARAGGGAVCTSGGVVCKPGIVTSVVETAEQLLDQRHMDADTLAPMLARGAARPPTASRPRRTSRSPGSGSGTSSRSCSTRSSSASPRRPSARSRARRTASRAARSTTRPRSRGPACRR